MSALLQLPNVPGNVMSLGVEYGGNQQKMLMLFIEQSVSVYFIN